MRSLRGGAYRSLWTGERQWEGLPGEFDFGQMGLVMPVDDTEGFVFYPALGLQRGQEYQVLCKARDFLVVGKLENA